MVLSRLESLPAELLQPIFLYSINVNLPLCNRIIGAQLSNAEAFQVATMDHLFPLSPTGKRNTDANSPAYKILASRYMTSTRFKVFFTGFLAWEQCQCADTCRCQCDAAEEMLDAILTASREDSERDQDARVPITHELCLKLYWLFMGFIIPAKTLTRPFRPDRANLLHFLLCCGAKLPKSHRKGFSQRKHTLFEDPAECHDPTMLACLFSKQLRLRFNFTLLHRAIINLGAPISSIDAITHTYKPSRLPGNPIVAHRARELRRRIEVWKERGGLWEEALHERLVRGVMVEPRVVVPSQMVPIG